MKSHFSPNRAAVAACAVAGATTVLTGNCSAQSFIAADYATNSTYTNGWSEGQNGGSGFGAWSFYGNDPATNILNTISTASPLGTAWTIFNLSNSSGIANGGRAINEAGGLQVGQTFETVIDNPIPTLFYRGWTISLNTGTNNNPGGVNTGEQLAVYHFEYFNYGQWTVADLSGNTGTTLHNTDTAVAGMKLDVTLTSATNYSLIMTPLGGTNAPYAQSGSLKANGPINWIQYNIYNTMSFGTNDYTNNFEISSMTIAGFPLNVHGAGSNVVLSWSTNVPGWTLTSSTNLGAGALWNPVSTQPVVINGENVVTNPASGAGQFYRLKQ